MQLTKTNKILISLIFIVVLIILGFKFMKKSETTIVDKNSKSTTTTPIPGTNLSLESNGAKYTITQVPVGNVSKSVPVPDLKRGITFNASLNLTDDAKKIITEKISALQTNLKNDPKNIGNWIQLGTDYKIIGDYTGAIIYWKYASDVSNDSISLGNLGNLYAYYLKDNAMAEMYYKKAISRAPTQAYLYIQLSDVYKTIFEDDAKAREILDEGLKQIPNDTSLLDAKKKI